MLDLDATVGSDVNGLPLWLDAVQRCHDALPELLVRADEVGPEAVEVFLEGVA